MRSHSLRTNALRHGPARRRAFSLVELLVVIAIIALLLAVLFPVFSRVRGNARTAACSSKLRQISVAWSEYATDNNSRFVSPRTDWSVAGTYHTWVRCEGSGLSGNVETLKSLENGLLFDYLDQDTSAYVSPLDGSGRVRSYSLNAYVGCKIPDDFAGLVPLPAGETDLDTRTMSRLPQPAQTMVALGEEAAIGYNQHGWVIDWTEAEWIDVPAFWDGNRMNVAFADGGTSTLNIMSPRFVAEAEAQGNYYLEPSEPATWYRMRQYLLPGRLPY